MLNQAEEQSLVEKVDEQGLTLLKRWQESGATVWVYFGARDGSASAAISARITEVSRCLAFKNQSSSLRFDIKGARFRYGPLQALLTPSRIGRVAVLTQKRGGLVSKNGVIVMLDSGHSLFISESEQAGADWLELPAGMTGLLEE